MDNGSQNGLALRRLPQGGFVVTDIYEQGQFMSEHFASTTIDDALRFMRDKVKPIGPEPSRDMSDFMTAVRKPIND